MRLSGESEKSGPIPPSDVQANYLPYDVLAGELGLTPESEGPCPEDTLGLVRHSSPVAGLPPRCHHLTKAGLHRKVVGVCQRLEDALWTGCPQRSLKVQVATPLMPARTLDKIAL